MTEKPIGVIFDEPFCHIKCRGIVAHLFRPSKLWRELPNLPHNMAHVCRQVAGFNGDARRHEHVPVKLHVSSFDFGHTFVSLVSSQLMSRKLLRASETSSRSRIGFR